MAIFGVAPRASSVRLAGKSCLTVIIGILMMNASPLLRAEMLQSSTPPSWRPRGCQCELGFPGGQAPASLVTCWYLGFSMSLISPDRLSRQADACQNCNRLLCGLKDGRQTNLNAPFAPAWVRD